MELKFLNSHSLFGGIEDAALKKIIPLLKKEIFEIGEDIIKEGETGDKLYLIYKGSVNVIKKIYHSNDEKILVSLFEGDTFGEMELIDVQPRTATIRTLEITTVYSLSAKDLHSICNQDLKTFTIIIMNLARDISRRLRKMDEWAIGERLE